MSGVPVNQAGELVYFGLAGSNTADKEEVIPFLQPERERFLEIAGAIQRRHGAEQLAAGDRRVR